MKFFNEILILILKLGTFHVPCHLLDNLVFYLPGTGTSYVHVGLLVNT